MAIETIYTYAEHRAAGIDPEIRMEGLEEIQKSIDAALKAEGRQ